MSNLEAPQMKGKRTVLLADLSLLFGRKVVDDVEQLAGRSAWTWRYERPAYLPYLLRLLALDHVGDSLAADIAAACQRMNSSREGRTHSRGLMSR